MADTRRTLAALQTLLADNTQQAISEQDLRDFLVSSLLRSADDDPTELANVMPPFYRYEHLYAKIIVGNAINVLTTDQSGYQNPPTNGDSFQYGILAQAATDYKLAFITDTGTDRGRFAVSINGGASIGTIDCYANPGSGGVAVVQALTGVTLKNGLNTITCLVSKNASSSDYYIVGFNMKAYRP